MNRLGQVIAGVALLALTACGGGSGPSGDGTAGTAQASPASTLAITVDQGPAALIAANAAAIDEPFVSVTLCTPGSASACQTVDHVLLDTGSSGLRVMASALTPALALPEAQDATSGRALRECAQFADGFAWGSVVTADVRLAGQVLSSIPIHTIGDTAAGTAPATCVSGPDENSVAAFGANGVLGIGNFLQDCGGACASSAVPGTYYACLAGGGTGCTPVAVALDRQVANPAALLPTNNNGVVIELPDVSAMGAASATGALTFGIGTQADNDTGPARFFGLDDAGTLVTVFGGRAQSGSFIDSGSNGLYFSDPSLPLCRDAPDFYCPAQTMTLGAVVQGLNGTTATVSFVVANADQLFSGEVSAAPSLAGPGASFDWGLPFFFGRRIYVLFEGRAAGSAPGPAIGF